MREILYRAKITGTDKWIQGLPYEVYDNGIDSIRSNGKIEYIAIDTLGQSSGLLDKKGCKIFEDDFLQFIKHKGYNMKSCIFLVTYDTDNASFGFINGSIPWFILHFDEMDEFKDDILDYCEIIGNFHDNPELLKPSK